jgi:NTP pyrophosphatase (non-canonical NTP hydrolase)
MSIILTVIQILVLAVGFLLAYGFAYQAAMEFFIEYDKKARKRMKVYDMTIADLIRESHATAVEKGWWEKDRSFGEGIALMHSELSEALEDWRRWGMDPSKFIIGPCFDEPAGDSAVVAGLAVELADVLIRVADHCGKYNIPLEEAIRAKMAYNKTRPYRHGGKLA